MAVAGWRTLLGAVGTAVVLAGCGGGAGADGVTSRDALGELATFDPCSVLAPESLAEFGNPSSEIRGRSFYDLGRCEFEIELDDGSVAVDAGMLTDLDHRPEFAKNRLRDVEGGMWVGQDEEADWCSQGLVFADDVTLEVTASGAEGDQLPDLCVVASTVMDTVITSVREDAVEQRDPAADSLLTIDACDVLPEDVVELAPALESAEKIDYPAGHMCRWDPAFGDWDSAYVSAQFGYGPPPEAKGYGQEDIEVAGRPSVLAPVTSGEPDEHGIAFCDVETRHIPFDGADEQPNAVEIATVRVSLPETDDKDAVCSVAERVAAQVWPELPTP